jgi:hypothetical protein
MTEQPVARRLTDLLTPEAHQRIINRLMGELNPATPELNKPILDKIKWHTDEVIKKTGELPRK